MMSWVHTLREANPDKEVCMVIERTITIDPLISGHCWGIEVLSANLRMYFMFYQSILDFIVRNLSEI